MKEGTYTDTIVAKITDNPEPVEFAIAAIGALPKAPVAHEVPPKTSGYVSLLPCPDTAKSERERERERERRAGEAGGSPWGGALFAG